MSQLPHDFNKARILVIGDIMLDRYVWGNVRRISPEAPVPVVKLAQTTESLGGAGYVANNLVSLGCRTTLIGTCGNDSAAQALRRLIDQKGINNRLIAVPARPTTMKTRIMAKKQQILRLDEEADIDSDWMMVPEVWETIEQEIQKASAIILSDYGKGFFLSETFTRKIITTALAREIPVLIDPKGNDWRKYTNATCITPNTAELEAVCGLDLEEDEKGLIQSARSIREKLALDYLLVTRGARGMCLIKGTGEPLLIPSQAREVYDVSGAGDTVIATLAACLANGMGCDTSCRIANRAAGIVVGKRGTQPIFFSELEAAIAWSDDQYQSIILTAKMADIEVALERIREWKRSANTIVFTNGCFDLLHPGHISLLYQARALGDRLIVGLNTDASVRRLKGADRPILAQRDRAAILGALECVDLVILFDEDTPIELINTLHPDILVKGSDYRADQVVGKDIVESYGGKVKLVDLIQGYSTTGLASKIKSGPQSSA